jgi:hypothetical protein
VDKWIKLGVDLKEDVRSIVKKSKNNISKEVKTEFFQLLDEFRDIKLKELGVTLQDRANVQTTKW